MSRANSRVMPGSGCRNRVPGCGWWWLEPNGTKHEYLLGPHLPRMRQEDVDLLHGLWKEVTSDPRYRELHHYHVLNVALQEMAERMHNGAYHDEVMREIFEEMRRSSAEPVADDEAPPPSPT